MNLKKLLGILLIALLAYFIIAQPANASSTATNLTESVQNAADNILQFVTSLTN